MPVFSSGQTVHQAADTYRALGCTDLIYACGGGLVAHPDGVQAGVRSLRQAWDAAVSCIPLHEYARDHAEVRAALEKYSA
jgi:ribulose-bisphosphate carboxylase large chain